MELKVFRDTLSAAGNCCTAKTEIPIETEILISDSLPQVFKIVKCFARPVVLQKQLQTGRLTLEGYLRCIVYYQAEGDAGLYQTEQKLPFSKTMELPSFEFSSWTASVGGETEYLNCRAVNQRRVEIRGAFRLFVSVATQLKREVITSISDCGVEQMQTAVSGVRRVAVLDKLITVDGAFSVEQENAVLLDITGTASLRELKLLNGKAVAKGEIRALCAWRGAKEKALQTQTAELPFNQILDVEGVSEDCQCLCVVEPVGFTVMQGEEGAEGTISITAVLHLRAWRPYTLRYVTDAFSTQYKTDNTAQTIGSERISSVLDDRVNVSASLSLPDENTKLLACFCSFSVPQVVQRTGGLQLSAHGMITAFGQNSLGEIESYEKTVECLLPLKISSGTELENLYPECWLSVENMNCGCSGGAIEVNATCHIEGTVLCRQENSCVEGIELGEAWVSEDPEISLRIYYAQTGESVFGIARKFHVSPAEMKAANGMETQEEVISAARRLLIPGKA